MLTGLLVAPDQSHRQVKFDMDQAQEFLGGAVVDKVDTTFPDAATEFTAIYNPNAGKDGADPNPVASLARSVGETDNAAFFLDPARAICGPVIFIDAEGDPLTEGDLTQLKSAIEAARVYREDHPQEYALWHSAARQMHG